MLGEGCRWRAIDCPECSWNSIYQYYRRWCRSGLWTLLLDEYGTTETGTLRFLDSTHVKVHSDGGNPAGGQQNQAMGRTKGGLNTKIHAVVDNACSPVAMQLSAGNEADISCAPAVIEKLEFGTLIADKAYDSDSFRDLLDSLDSKVCIPPRSNRLYPRKHSKHIYKKRHRVENFFQRLKIYRRVATRYDKLAETYFGFVCLAAFIIETNV